MILNLFRLLLPETRNQLSLDQENDYKVVMKQMEVALQQLLSYGKEKQPQDTAHKEPLSYMVSVVRIRSANDLGVSGPIEEPRK
ncbi:hypothetical protein A6R68_04340, partial [Neotoma lepida]